MSILGETLANEVIKTFSRWRQDPEILRLMAKADAGRAAYADADRVADRLGNMLADAWNKHVTADVLPDGYMSAELAREILYPTGYEAYLPAADYARRIQERIYQKGGVNLKAQVPEYNTDRVDGIATMIGRAEQYETHAKEVEQSLVNVTQAVVDEAVKKNAEFIQSAGGRSIITRVGDTDPCAWCSSLIGSYEYGSGKEPEDLYRRHRDCHCIVALELPGGRWQDAHRKISYDSVREARLERERELTTVLDSNVGKKRRINYAKAIDYFTTDGIQSSISPDEIYSYLSEREVGKHALNYLQDNNLKVTLDYNSRADNNRGVQEGDTITIHMQNVPSTRVGAQTVVHEVAHHEYKIPSSQFAEAISFAHEKMLIEDRTYLTMSEWQQMLSLAEDYYGDLRIAVQGFDNYEKYIKVIDDKAL